MADLEAVRVHRDDLQTTCPSSWTASIARPIVGLPAFEFWGWHNKDLPRSASAPTGSA